jgi:glycosyltransferase involved in cell wall biosynthesis
MGVGVAMKVGLVTDDAVAHGGHVQWKTTGVGRYTKELHRGLAASGVSVGLIYAEAPHWPLGEAVKHVLAMPLAVRSKAGQFDLLHASSPITALGFAVSRKPKVVTYHDLVPLVCRNASVAFHSGLLAPIFLRVGLLADKIIAISSQTKQEMVTHLGISEEKIAVVNYGVSEMFRPLGDVSRGNNVLGYVGTLDRRKGVDYLMRAIAVFKEKYPRTPIKLKICSSRAHEYESLVELASTLGVRREVDFGDMVLGESLVRAYNSFDVLVHPSEWEGFGFPIVEAQRCGVPVIVRQDAHIPEEVSACCLKAATEENMADKIYTLLTDAESRQDLAGRGLEYSQQFTWDRAVQQTVSVYQELLSTG